MDNVGAFVMAGGLGTRLWPLSKLNFPKQFNNIIDHHSLLQQTLLLNNFFSNLFVITHNDFLFLLLEQLNQINIESKIILESSGKSTAPCGVIAALIGKKFNYDYVVLLPSDHYITSKDDYINSISQSINLASIYNVITIGVKPTEARIGYGYIKVMKKINEDSFFVEKFIEKPDLSKASSYIDREDYFWNSGIFIFNPDKLLYLVSQIEPEMVDIITLSLSRAKIIGDIIQLSEEYNSIKSNSFDYEFMEKINNVAMIKSVFQWKEIGDWKGVSEIVDKDNNNNTIIGDVFVHEVKDSYINSDNGVVSVIGVENLIVVNNNHSILIANKSKVEDIKKIVNDIDFQEKNNIVYRPWGHYIIIDKAEFYLVKKIRININQQISLQYHLHRSEHWVVVNGFAKIQLGDLIYELSKNDAIYVPKTIYHKIKNIGKSYLDIIEVQTGEYLGEDDIVRIEDICETKDERFI